MRILATIFPAVLIFGSLSPPCWAGDIKDYLTADGNLKEKVTLSIYQVFDPGCPKHETAVWSIEPSGAWTHEIKFTTWLTGGSALKAKGQLTKQQRIALAHHLAAQDLKGLPLSVLKVDPTKDRIVRSWKIDFGKHSTNLDIAFPGLAVPAKIEIDPDDRFQVAASAPPADDPRAGEWSRFAALTLVLEDTFKRTRLDTKKDTGEKK